MLYDIDPSLESLLMRPDAELIMLEDGSAVDTETGEIFTKEALDAFMQYKDAAEKDKKVEQCLKFIKNQKAELEMLKAEIEALRHKKKMCSNRIDRTKAYIAEFLGYEKFSSPAVSVRFTKNYSCDVTCPAEELPVAFQRVTYEPNKTELTKFLKNGGLVDGVKLTQSYSMVLK